MERVLLAIIVLEVPIQIDTYLDYQVDLADFGAIGGLNVSVTTVCLIALYGLWMARTVVRRKSIDDEATRYNVPLLCYFGSCVISFLIAHDRTLVTFELFLLAQALMICHYMINHIRSRKDIVFVLRLLVIGLAIQGVVICTVRMVGHTIQLGPLRAEMYLSSRIAGTLGSPISAASYLALMLAVAISVQATTLDWKHKLFAMLSFVLGTFALVFTLSRGAWLAFFFSCGFVAFLAWCRNWFSSVLIALTLLSCMLVLGVFHAEIFERLTADDDGSAGARGPLLRLASEVILDNPIFGVGANNCAVVTQEYAGQCAYRGEWFYTVHNKYALVWVETGILGLGTFLWFLLSSLRNGWQIWQKKDRLLSPLALGCSAAIVSQMTHMMVDVFNSRTQATTLWIVTALITAISHVADRGER